MTLSECPETLQRLSSCLMSMFKWQCPLAAVLIMMEKEEIRWHYYRATKSAYRGGGGGWITPFTPGIKLRTVTGSSISVRKITLMQVSESVRPHLEVVRFTLWSDLNRCQCIRRKSVQWVESSGRPASSCQLKQAPLKGSSNSWKSSIPKSHLEMNDIRLWQQFL